MADSAKRRLRKLQAFDVAHHGWLQHAHSELACGAQSTPLGQAQQAANLSSLLAYNPGSVQVRSSWLAGQHHMRCCHALYGITKYSAVRGAVILLTPACKHNMSQTAWLSLLAARSQWWATT